MSNDGHGMRTEAEKAVLDLSGEAFVPHKWLLPRCRGIVHHGGSGTTGAALRCLVTMDGLVTTAGRSSCFLVTDASSWFRRDFTADTKVYLLSLKPKVI